MHQHMLLYKCVCTMFRECLETAWANTQQGVMMNKKPDNVISVPFAQPEVAKKLLEVKQLRQRLQANITKYDDIRQHHKQQNNDEHKE